MKRVICDQCRAEVEPDGYGFAPEGWLSVSKRGKAYLPPADYCSNTCAIAALSTEPPTAAPDPAATEAATVQ